jgi:hypothetical protein
MREFRIFRINALFDLLDISRYSKKFYHVISDGSRE